MKKSKKIIIVITMLALLAVSFSCTVFALTNDTPYRNEYRPYMIPDSIEFRGSDNNSTRVQLDDVYADLDNTSTQIQISGRNNTYCSSVFIRTKKDNLNRPLDTISTSIGYIAVPRGDNEWEEYFRGNVSWYPCGDQKEIVEYPYLESGAISSQYTSLLYDTLYYSTFYLHQFDIVYLTSVFFPLGTSNEEVVERAMLQNIVITVQFDYPTEVGYRTETYVMRVLPTLVDAHETETYVTTDCKQGTAMYYLEDFSFNLPDTCQMVDGVTELRNVSININGVQGNAFGVSNTGGNKVSITTQCSALSELQYDTLSKTFLGVDERTDFMTVNVVGWLSNSLDGLLNTPIFGFVSLGGLVMVCVSVGVAILILKIFAGG